MDALGRPWWRWQNIRLSANWMTPVLETQSAIRPLVLMTVSEDLGLPGTAPRRAGPSQCDLKPKRIALWHVGPSLTWRRRQYCVRSWWWPVFRTKLKSCRSWSEFSEIQTLICKEMCKKFLVLTESWRSRTSLENLISAAMKQAAPHTCFFLVFI